MKATLRFGREELEELLEKEAAKNGYAVDSDVRWDASLYDHDDAPVRFEAEVDVRPMTPEERAEALADARPLHERIGAHLAEQVDARIGERDDAFIEGLGSQLMLFSEVVRQLLEDQGREDIDDWMNILIGKLDKLKEGQVILSNQMQKEDGVTLAAVRTYRGPIPEVMHGAAEAIQHEEGVGAPNEYEGLTEEEKKSRRRLERVRSEIEQDEAELDAKLRAQGKPGRNQLYTESNEFPADMRVTRDD